jgi:GT2 family glycosyltransferase
VLPTVAVVVPTRNRRARISRTVDCVLDDPATTEVVVVDDGSDDGTDELVRGRAATDARVRLVRVPHGGQAAARQAGIDAATAEVVLLLDDDVLAGAGLVTRHARHHASEQGVVVVGYMPTALPHPRRPGQVATFLYAGDYEAHVRRWEAEPTSVLRTLWGGNVSLRRVDAQRVGMVATGPRLPYREDQELGIRLELAGLRGIFDRSLLATHEHRRDIDAFLREAPNRGTGAHLIHLAHASELGPLRLERYEEHLPRPAAAAVRLAHQRRVAAVELGSLRLLLRVAGALRWWKLESMAAIVAMHIIELRTIIDLRGGAS